MAQSKSSNDPISSTISSARLRTHQDIASHAPSAALTMQVSVSAGSGTTISVYESIELVATTPNGHTYLDGIFSWEPLGCS
ncbi:MAG: hypothetical protein CAF45_001525 [Nitrospira sp. CG24E]|nr:MAG: hypothetical protein CAF45_001525 [Nitrospira sp. CG24E]